MKLRPGRWTPNAEDVIEEIERYVHASSRTADDIAAERRSHRVRVNPRTGEMSEGVLCYLCAARPVAEHHSRRFTRLCFTCGGIDVRAARALSLPMVLPVRKTNRPFSSFSRLPLSATLEQGLSQIAALHADVTPLSQWRRSVVRATAMCGNVIMWPDVPLALWQETVDGSLERCAHWYKDFLEQTCPRLMVVEPRLADVDFLQGRLY